MTSILRQLQAEWNTLVPAAQARRIPRVRMLNAPLETIEYRRSKLEWLRAQLGTLNDLGDLTFGVELEFLMPVGMAADRLAAAIQAVGVPCHAESYGHVTGSHWKIVTDGSLGDYTRGRELVSPVLRGEAGFDALRKACTVLERVGCKVSKKCGLHVHVGVRSEPIDFFKNLVRLYASAERAIDSFMAPSRRGPEGGNGFCKALRVSERALDLATNLDGVARAIGQTPGAANARNGGRYYKVNVQSYWQHGTVEFRHHQGTVDANKAENWVRLCLRMCLTCRAGSKVARTVDDLMEAVEAVQSEKDYFAGRVRFFNRETVVDTVANHFLDHADRAQVPARNR